MKNIPKRKTRNLIVIMSIIFLIMISTVAFAESDAIEDTKITITKMDTSDVFPRDMILQPISLTIISGLSSVDYISEVIPIVTIIHRNHPDGDFMPDPNNMSDFPGSPPNDGSMPDPANMSDFPGSFPGDRMRNQQGTYTVEGVENLEYYLSSILSIDLESGVYPSESDSYDVIIGKDAQEYFNTSLHGTSTIENTDFSVIGIFDDESYNSYVFMNLGTAQSLTGLTTDEVNTIHLYADNSSLVEDIITELSEDYSEYQIRSASFMINDESFNPYATQQNQDITQNEGSTNNTPGFETALLIFIICITILMKTIVGDKKR